MFLLALMPSVVPVGGSVAPSQAATVSDNGQCAQTVGSAADVTVSAIGADCVIRFRNGVATNWTVPAGIAQADVLLVGGGGGGGGREWAGGGGGGGVLYGEGVSLENLASGGVISVVAGAGGSGGLNTNDETARGGNGSASSFGGVTAAGGGGGGGKGWAIAYSGQGNPGGSGGGSGEHGDNTLRNGQLVYSLTDPRRDSNGAITYITNNSVLLDNANTPITRITYRMQVEVDGVTRFAEASFDPWESNLRAVDLRVPDVQTSNANKFTIQRFVNNMRVDSNLESNSIARSTGVITSSAPADRTGYLEIWPWNYSTARSPNGPVGGGSVFDFNDTPSGADDHGSFQVHDVTTVGSERTVLAWNLHRNLTNPEIGLGNWTGSHPDWTSSGASSLGTTNWRLDIRINKNQFQSLAGGASEMLAPTGFVAYGNAGGSVDSVGSRAGSGGGGAGALGGVSPFTSYQPINGVLQPQVAGNGGAGRSFSISGASVSYAGGGGGGAGEADTDTCSVGGTGGGGAGGCGRPSSTTTAAAGTDGLGGGGGGARSGVGADGGDGVVIVRYTRATPTVSWAPTNTTVAASDATVTLSPAASASSGTAVTYSVVSAGTASCSISNSSVPTVAFSAAGTCTLKATAASDSSFVAADSSLVTLTAGYRVTFDANSSQHQQGVTSGAVPGAVVYAPGATVTVPANPGNLKRQGFTLDGWRTTTSGGTRYVLGTGTFLISSNTTLYASWAIPEAARLIGGTGDLAVSTKTVTDGAGTAFGMRGITTDGSSVFFRTTDREGAIREANFDGGFVEDHLVSGLANTDQRDLAYSNGCIFLRGANAGDLSCIDTTTWTMHSITVPSSHPLDVGGLWLTGNLIDFPDGRVGAVSAPGTIAQRAPAGVDCPAGMYCKRLRLYTPLGTGQNLTLSHSEDIILADTEPNWPDDDHGIATDGTYLYQIRHIKGYKVWALESGKPSYLVFNGDGSGACGANAGTSNTLCSITQGLTNATFMTRDHVGKRYLVGDFGNRATNDAFYITASAAPPAGPGTPDLPASPTAVTGVSGSGEVIVSWTASPDPVNGPVLSYTVTANPGGASCTTATTSCTVTGLTNGQSYTFSVVATNVTGASASSTPSASVTVQLATQTITFLQPAGKTYGDSSFTVAPTANSGLSVSLASGDTSVCTVSGTTVTIVSVGNCSLTATQTGDSEYAAATPVTRSFTIAPKPITMSVVIQGKSFDGTSSAAISGTPTLTGLVSGDEGYVAVVSANISAEFDDPNAGIAKPVTVTLGEGVLGAGASGNRSDRYSVTVAGSPTATITQANQASLAVTSANSMVFGQTIPLVAVGGSGSGALSYSKVSGPCTVSGATVTSSGAGSCVVTATRAGDTNYNAVTSSQFTITVSKAAQSINFTSTVPVSAVSGTTYTPAATASSGLTVSFAITTGDQSVCSLSAGVVTFTTSGTCVITASQSGDLDYNAAPAVTQTIVAGKVNQTLTFPAISGKTFSDPAFAAGATVSSGRSVTYATTTSSVCAVNSTTGVISITAVGDCTITASSAGDASFAAASDVSRTFTISPVVPGKPSITSVSFGNSAVTVAFSAPSFVGGDAIDGYQVVATSSGGSVTKPDCAATSPCTITGLTNGEAYTLTVSAINAAGVGPASDASPSITPATIPDAVSALTTTPGDGQLQVDWSQATSFGGGSFTRYEVSLRVRGTEWGTPVSLNSVTTETYTFTGLTNGTAYDVKLVTISSANGSELASNTATALGVPATAPVAPTGLSALALSNTTAVASWSAPVDDGGAAITAYAVNLACVFVNPTDSFCELSGLRAGDTVTITVGATNLIGTGQTVSVSITMPGGNTGGSPGGAGAGSSATQTPTVIPSPVVVRPRVIVPPQPTPAPREFTGPVQSPGRGFDPNQGTRATIGGQPATVTKQPTTGGAGVQLQAGALQLGLTLNQPGVGGSGVDSNNPTNSPELVIPRGQSTSLNGGGLLPGSQLQIWLPGNGTAPRELAKVPVKNDGTFDSQVSFTASRGEAPIPIGRQVMQVTGYDERGNATIVDMTVNIAQGAPTPEPNRRDNVLPALSPGQSLATSAGIPETVTVEVRTQTREVAVVSGDWEFTVSFGDDAGEVGTGGTLTFVQEKTASVSGSGFQPETRVDIWLFSEPTLLGSVTVSADGSFTGEVYLDTRFATAGSHTLQLQGVGTDGFIKAANLGVVVQESVSLSAERAGGMLWWVFALVAVLVLSAGVTILVARRRTASRF